MQVSFKRRNGRRTAHAAALSELHQGEHGILDRIDLPHDEAQRIMELGFVPGTLVAAARCAPGGDPRVYQVDGSEIAMRRETAVHMKLRHPVPRDVL